MKKYQLVSDAGRLMQPVDVATLRSMVAGKIITPETKLVDVDSGETLQAVQVPGLAEEFIKSTPVPSQEPSEFWRSASGNRAILVIVATCICVMAGSCFVVARLNSGGSYGSAGATAEEMDIMGVWRTRDGFYGATFIGTTRRGGVGPVRSPRTWYYFAYRLDNGTAILDNVDENSNIIPGTRNHIRYSMDADKNVLRWAEYTLYRVQD